MRRSNGASKPEGRGASGCPGIDPATALTCAGIEAACLDAERDVLGTCLLFPEVVPAVARLLKPTDFYHHKHEQIFAAVLAVFRDHGTVDPILVCEEIGRRRQLEETGGREYLLDLSQVVVAAAGVEFRARIVVDHARRRAQVALARDIVQRASQGEHPNEIAAVIARSCDQDADRAAVHVALTPTDILARWDREGPLVHVSTGFSRLDALTGGGPPFGARCYVLGAPDAGKTAFVVQVADQLLAQGICVGFHAIDEEPGDVLMRFLQRRGFARHDCEVRDKAQLAAMASSLSNAGLFLYGDTVTIEAAAEDLAARAKERGRRAAYFVDSIQTARSISEHEGASMHTIVTQRTRAIRAVTTSFGLITYATSEMARASYRSIDTADRVSDMAAAKESGAIEYTARFMVTLRNVAGETDLIEASITKNKFGPRTREGEPGVFLRLDRAAQRLAEDPTFVAPTKAERQERQAVDRGRRAIADAAVLAGVIVDERGIAKTAAEDEFMRRAQCGTTRWKAAYALLRKAIVEEAGPRNRRSLFLNGADVRPEVIVQVPIDDRPRVLASVPPIELHRAAPRSTRGAGAPASELHHHPLRSRGGAARECSPKLERVAPHDDGAAREEETTC